MAITMLNIFRKFVPTNRVLALNKMSLFTALTSREMKIVHGFMHERSYLKGEIIFDAGEEGQALYIVLEGKVLVCRQGHPESPIATLERGNFFGEIALLDGGPRSGQVRAAEDCTMAVLFSGDFKNLMQSHGMIASKIALQLALYLGTRLRLVLGADQVLL